MAISLASRSRQVPTKGRLRGNVAIHSRGFGEKRTRNRHFPTNELRFINTYDRGCLGVYGLGFRDPEPLNLNPPRFEHRYGSLLHISSADLGSPLLLQTEDNDDECNTDDSW